MASKELLDIYQSDLGNYFKVTMAKYFCEYPDGEAGFIESLMIFPREEFSYDTRQAETAMNKFNTEYGQKHGVELWSVGFDKNLRPIYYLYFWLYFESDIYGDGRAEFAVGAQSYFDIESYQIILEQVSDEGLLYEHAEVKMGLFSDS